MDDKIFAVHSELSSGLKGKEISKNLHFTWTKSQAVSGLPMNRNQTQQCIYCTSRRAIAIFPLEQLNVVWTFRKNPHCGLQQGIVFALDLPLLHSFHSAAVQPLTCKGSDKSAHKNLFRKPSAPGLDSQSFIRQITPEEVHRHLKFVTRSIL